MRTTVPVDLSDERFERGVPFDVLAQLRRDAPVWWWPEGSCWVVTTHQLVEMMNRDFESYSSEGGIVPPGSTINPSVLLAMDPPVHTEYRRMVIRSFVPRSIAALEADIRAIAHEAVDEFRAQGGGDFVPDIATAIPFRVMAHLTGVPRSAERMIMRWGNAIAPNSDPEYRPTPTSMMEAQEALSEYLGEQFEERRRAPREDLLSDLLRIQHAGEPLAEEDLRGFAINYLLGGTETTRNLIAQALLVLLEHPAQLRRFTDGEVDAATMVEELLRWVTPVLHHSRWATRAADVAGQTISAGDRVTLWMVSANRDEEAFEHPDELDISRTPNHHVSLGGGGPHYCLGAHLARLETIVTFETLRPLLASVRLSAPPQRVRSNFINGIKHVEVSIIA
ncbi:MAG TPA: cytochrome P450 [Acidimicrobiales bacterium]|jgi:cytochrome P450|nr:cytochrome P450 [Acidimicrobiales bacterium]